MTPRPAVVPAPRVRIEAVHKSFAGVPVLRGVSLTLAPASVLGLVGENGAGKSTLMNILGGHLRPDAGSIHVDGGVYQPRGAGDARQAGVAFVHQELTLFPNLTIAENLHLVRFPRRLGGWIDRPASRRLASDQLARVGLRRGPDTPVEQLAAGERQLVEIARALTHDARVLILDEPTTSLGALERQRLHDLIRELRHDGLSIVYISHELGDVLRECDRIAVLRDGTVVAEGDTGEFSVGGLVRHMVGREVRQFYPAPRQAAVREPLLHVRGLSRGTRVGPTTLTVGVGEIVGVFGLMGAGRSELARLIFGLDKPSAGVVLLDGRTLVGAPPGRIASGLAFVTEDRRLDGLCLEAPIAENLALASLRRLPRSSVGVLTGATIGRAARQIGGAVGLDEQVDLSAAVGRLSGGNQQKVVLGKWLLTRPRMLLLDEPTRGIDVGARAEIYQLLHRLADAGTGLLVFSSDLDELMGISDRILVMRHGELNGEFHSIAFDREELLRAALPASVA